MDTIITFKRKNQEVINLIQDAKMHNLSLSQQARRSGKQEDFFYDYSRRSLPTYLKKGKIDIVDYNNFIDAYLPFKQKQRKLKKIENKKRTRLSRFFNKFFK